MIISLAQIPEDGLDISGEIDSSILEVPDLTSKSPIRCTLHVSKQEEAILIRGMLEMTALTPCARCLELLPVKLVVEDFVQLTEDLTKTEIDISPAVREEILLVLPNYSKCELSSSGTCPIFGKNWSSLNPDTPSAPLSDPWSVLDNYQKSDKN